MLHCDTNFGVQVANHFAGCNVGGVATGDLLCQQQSKMASDADDRDSLSGEDVSELCKVHHPDYLMLQLPKKWHKLEYLKKSILHEIFFKYNDLFSVKEFILI